MGPARRADNRTQALIRGLSPEEIMEYANAYLDALPLEKQQELLAQRQQSMKTSADSVASSSQDQHTSVRTTVIDVDLASKMADTLNAMQNFGVPAKAQGRSTRRKGKKKMPSFLLRPATPAPTGILPCTPTPPVLPEICRSSTGLVSAIALVGQDDSTSGAEDAGYAAANTNQSSASSPPHQSVLNM
ncbi:hypothetical protein RI367_001723 [Sorochytrium milnesiophthora]